MGPPYCIHCGVVSIYGVMYVYGNMYVCVRRTVGGGGGRMGYPLRQLNTTQFLSGAFSSWQHRTGHRSRLNRSVAL